MLALATGWTPDVLAELPAKFRAACHHVLLMRTLLPDEGLAPLPDTAGMTGQQKAAIARAAIAQAELRKLLFPEDDDV